GATLTSEGVNFAIYSSGATRVELCLFDPQGERELARLPLPERTEHVWHGFLPKPHGVAGLVYGYRVHGPYDPQHGSRYNPNKLVLEDRKSVVEGKSVARQEGLGSVKRRCGEVARSEYETVVAE